ncbi:MAG: hypothetical protein AB7F20_05040 [Geoalkalibacter sp.]|uniref:hypothetical protein n=1 Tax=Geoalkalibacter sp. TaxID=3041440 RepID=UPI003D14AABA
MPNKAFLRNFRASVSHERLDKYRQRGVAGGDENLLIHYAWNIALGESLYPVLQCMEIALRNAVHDAASAAFQTPYWFDTPHLLDSRSGAGIAEARNNLAAEGKPITAAGIVAEQNFGFWTACFNRRQEQVLWPRIYRQVFPGLPRYLRTRNTIANRLNEIRKLRNRIFHHEPIWYFNDLREKHTRILELIGWISPAMAEFVGAIDRFPDLYAAGMPAYKAELERKFLRIAPSQPTL